MSGDKRAKEIFYRASQKDGFEEDIVAFRKKHKIPKEGFFNKSKKMDWKSTSRQEYEDDANKLLKKYSIPFPLRRLLYSYINYSADVEHNYPLHEFACDFDDPRFDGTRMSVERLWKESGTKYTRLLIHDSASLEDVKDFLDTHWPRMEQDLRGRGKDKKPLVYATSDKRKRKKELVIKFYKMTREQLGLKKGEYKNKGIADRLKDYGFHISEDNVKQIISRYRRSKK